MDSQPFSFYVVFGVNVLFPEVFSWTVYFMQWIAYYGASKGVNIYFGYAFSIPAVIAAEIVIIMPLTAMAVQLLYGSIMGPFNSLRLLFWRLRHAPVSSMSRWLKGRLLWFVYATGVSLVALVIAATVSGLSPDSAFDRQTIVSLRDASPWLITPILATWLFFLFGTRPKIIFWTGISRLTRPLRQGLRELHFGFGGSARFAPFLREMETLWKPESILFGRSLYGKHYVLGEDDDRHLLTIAGTRGGKGISNIIPNLLCWPGSALVIDPKGTNALVTAHARGQGGGRVKPSDALGQDVHVVDPYGITDLEPKKYNPLADLDPSNPGIVDDIKFLAEAMIIPSEHVVESHWDASASIIIQGLIAHILTDPIFRANKQVYLTTCWYLLNTNDDLDGLWERMSRNPALNGVARSAAALLRNAGDRERGAMLTTTRRNLEWMKSPEVASLLEGEDFSLLDLKRRRMTVYLCLPIARLEQQPRLLRMFVNMAFYAISVVPNQPGQKQCLFLLDEFYFLGPIRRLIASAGLMAGMGMKLWPIVQNMGQITELYPKNWQAFLTGTVQMFSISDQHSLDYLVNVLGRRWVEDNLFQLLEHQEVNRLLDRDTGYQIVLRPGKDPLFLRRLPYFKFFKRKAYDPDPDYQETSWWQRLTGKSRPPVPETEPLPDFVPWYMNESDYAEHMSGPAQQPEYETGVVSYEQAMQDRKVIDFMAELEKRGRVRFVEDNEPDR